MDKEIDSLHRKLGRSKFAVYLIIGFLALLTYLLIVVSNQVQQQAMTSDSEATGLARSQSGVSISNSSTDNGDSQGGSSTTTSNTQSSDQQSQPSGTCSANGKITGPDRGFGKKLDCSYSCGGVSKTVQKASGWTQAECQIEAERLCGCGQTGACGGRWTSVKKVIENPDQLYSKCLETISVTCPQSGKAHLIDNIRTDCSSSEVARDTAARLCCADTSKDRLCDRFGNSDELVCHAICQVHHNRDCVRSTAYPDTWTCGANDLALCPATP